MRFSVHGFFLLLIAVLQTTLFEYIEVLGVKPNLFLVYVLILSFFCSKKESLILGAVFGLTFDVLIGKFLGMNALMCSVSGFFTAHFCEKVLGNKNVLIVFLFTVVISVFYELINHLFSFLIIGDVDLIYAFKSVIFIECVYNGLMVFLLYPIIKKLTKFMYADKGENLG